MMRLSLIWYEWFKDSEKGGLGDGKPIYTLDVQSGKKSFSKNHFSIFQKSNSSFPFFQKIQFDCEFEQKIKAKIGELAKFNLVTVMLVIKSWWLQDGIFSRCWWQIKFVCDIFDVKIS